MKRKTTLAMLLFLLACGPWASGQMFSSTTRMSNCTGSRTIVRQNQIGQTVICYHDSHNISSFVVEGTGKKKFATSVYLTSTGPVLNPVLNVGYHVRDMEILDDMCWFCGDRWEETGEWILTPGGQAYKEVTHKGFVGRFSISGVLAGNGNCEIMEIPNVEALTNLAVYTGGVTAITGGEEYYPSSVVELKETSSPNAYYVSIIHPSDNNEVFMDVACAGGKVVTLSRFRPTSITDSAKYKYYFGLRYGTPSNFAATANTIYNYRTYKVFFPANIGRFSGLTPIFLSHTNQGNEVVVSYLGSDPGFFQGRLLMALVPSVGASTVQTRMNFDSDNVPIYSELKEVHFNNPFGLYSKMAVLAKDVNGYSTFRFPRWDTFNHDTIMRTNDFDIESFTYYNSGTNLFDVIGTGPNSANKINELRQNVNDDWPTWNTMNCMSTSTGHIYGDPGYDCMEIDSDYGLTVKTILTKTFLTINCSLSTPTYFQTCSDGVSNNIQPLN